MCIYTLRFSKCNCCFIQSLYKVYTKTYKAWQRHGEFRCRKRIKFEDSTLRFFAHLGLFGSDPILRVQIPSLTREQNLFAK